VKNKKRDYQKHNGYNRGFKTDGRKKCLEKRNRMNDIYENGKIFRGKCFHRIHSETKLTRVSHSQERSHKGSYVTHAQGMSNYDNSFLVPYVVSLMRQAWKSLLLL
jgi:hypothetical protein